MNKLVSHKFQPTYIYFILCGLIVLERIYNFVHFNLAIVDSDQPLFWLGAVEMLHGNFYEPAVYGQSYNTFLESLLAVPFLGMGMPIYIALPLVTNILALLPLFLLTRLAFNKDNIYGAIAILCYFLLLPAEYMFITSIPRGFITGVTAAILGIYIFEKKTPLTLFIGTCIIGCSLTINPNSLLLLIPYGILHRSLFKDKKNYIYILSGFSIPFLYFLYIKTFYYIYPHYIVHPAPTSKFTFEHFRKIFQSDTLKSFYHLGPFIHLGGIAILGFILFASTKIKPEYINFKRGIILLLLLLPIFFGFEKIHDGEASVFFPASRMFLALPFILALILVYSSLQFLQTPKANYIYLFVIVWVFVKCAFITERTGRSIKENGKAVIVELRADINAKINDVLLLAKKHHTKKIILDYKNDFFLYGIPAITDKTYQTMGCTYERRFWVYEQIKKDTCHKALYISMEYPKHLLAYSPQLISNQGKDSIYLISDYHSKSPFLPFIEQVSQKRAAAYKSI